jgi:hypothetical protein
VNQSSESNHIPESLYSLPLYTGRGKKSASISNIIDESRTILVQLSILLCCICIWEKRETLVGHFCYIPKHNGYFEKKHLCYCFSCELSRLLFHGTLFLLKTTIAWQTDYSDLVIWWTFFTHTHTHTHTHTQRQSKSVTSRETINSQYVLPIKMIKIGAFKQKIRLLENLFLLTASQHLKTFLKISMATLTNTFWYYKMGCFNF